MSDPNFAMNLWNRCLSGATRHCHITCWSLIGEAWQPHSCQYRKNSGPLVLQAVEMRYLQRRRHTSLQHNGDMWACSRSLASWNVSTSWHPFAHSPWGKKIKITKFSLTEFTMYTGLQLAVALAKCEPTLLTECLPASKMLFVCWFIVVSLLGHKQHEIRALFKKFDSVIVRKAKRNTYLIIR